MRKLNLLSLLLCFAVSSLAADWDSVEIPAKLEDGQIWQLLPLSDDFNYKAPANGKNEEFNRRWVEGYINNWTGPGWTEWHSS